MSTKLIATLALLAAISPTTHAQLDLKGLFDSVKSAIQPSDNTPSNSQPEGGDGELNSAVAEYKRLIDGLSKKNALPANDFSMYLPKRSDVVFTQTSMPDVYALRIVPTDEFAKKSPEAYLMFVFQPIVLFPKGGAGFFTVNTRDGKSPAPSSWIAYDAASSTFKIGADARPFVEQILQISDTRGLPKFGNGRVSFIYASEIECPYCVKIEDQVRSMGLTYRVLPREFNNWAVSHPYNNAIYCAKDPAAAWSLYIKPKNRPKLIGDQKYCPPNIKPVYTIKEFEMIFGITATPAFFFPDGTILIGADKLPQVKEKAKELEKRGVYFL